MQNVRIGTIFVIVPFPTKCMDRDYFCMVLPAIAIILPWNTMKLKWEGIFFIFF